MPAFEELTGQTREEWLALRTTGVGASDAPVVLGISPYQSALALWAQKTGQVADSPVEEERMRWGRLLEPLIRAEYGERTGRRVLYPGPWTTLRSTTRPWMLASVDGIVAGDPEGPGILECKCSERGLGLDEDSNGGPPVLEPPEHWVVQVQHAMDVVGAQWAEIAVLIGGARLVILPRIARSEAFLEPLRMAEQGFYTRVTQKIRPEVDHTELTKLALAILYPTHRPDSYVDVDPRWLAKLDNEMESAKADAKDAEGRCTAVGNALKAVIGEHEGLRGGGLTYSWKSQARAAYTVPAGVQRVLRRHQGKLNKAKGKA
jgi:putative phage-type endonuclease